MVRFLGPLHKFSHIPGFRTPTSRWSIRNRRVFGSQRRARTDLIAETEIRSCPEHHESNEIRRPTHPISDPPPRYRVSSSTARFRCPETGTVCKFVHRSQKRDGNYSKSYCYGAISDNQNRDVQKFGNWHRFKSEILIVTCISTSPKHDVSTHARTDGQLFWRSQNMRKPLGGIPFPVVSLHF